MLMCDAGDFLVFKGVVGHCCQQPLQARCDFWGSHHTDASVVCGKWYYLLIFAFAEEMLAQFRENIFAEKNFFYSPFVLLSSTLAVLLSQFVISLYSSFLRFQYIVNLFPQQSF